MEHLPDLVAILVSGLFALGHKYPVIWVFVAIIAIKYVVAKVKEGNAGAGKSANETNRRQK